MGESDISICEAAPASHIMGIRLFGKKEPNCI